jgi:hypothetical protein
MEVGKSKSATNAVKAIVDNMDTFDVACGVGHTLLLVNLKKKRNGRDSLLLEYCHLQQ